MVLVLAKCGKISNVHVARSVIIVVLKKNVPTIRKSCDSYHEKAVPAVKKSVTTIMRQLIVVCFR